MKHCTILESTSNNHNALNLLIDTDGNVIMHDTNLASLHRRIAKRTDIKLYNHTQLKGQQAIKAYFANLTN